MENPELTRQFQIYEQQIMQTQEQLTAVVNSINNLREIKDGLNSLIGKTGTEIKAQVGRGIYLNAKLLNEELIVDIGDKKFVTKSISEAQELIRTQIDKLIEAEKKLSQDLKIIDQKITELMAEYQNPEEK